jgi:hypothetical protein
MKDGNKSDKVDARKLAYLLRGGYLRSFYQGENAMWCAMAAGSWSWKPSFGRDRGSEPLPPTNRC